MLWSAVFFSVVINLVINQNFPKPIPKYKNSLFQTLPLNTKKPVDLTHDK